MELLIFLFPKAFLQELLWQTELLKQLLIYDLYLVEVELKQLIH